MEVGQEDDRVVNDTSLLERGRNLRQVVPCAAGPFASAAAREADAGLGQLGRWLRAAGAKLALVEQEGRWRRGDRGHVEERHQRAIEKRRGK
jgi:hypothetical protein